MKIIDKASWQIDGDIQPSLVIAHFKRIFSWLESEKFLTEEGQEIFSLGIDESISLHERLITPEALAFFEAKYDDYLKRCSYGKDDDLSILKTFFVDYQEGRRS